MSGASKALKSKKTVILSALQKLGKSLMLPIAILPVAGLLNRLGAEDLLNLPFMQDAGATIFTYLPLLFAIGIAVGLAEENHGVAALAGVVSYFVVGAVSQDINYALQLGTLAAPPEGYDALVEAGKLAKIDMQVFHGIVAGVIGGICYNKFKAIKLPDWLQFFGGKRFVPIATGGFSLVVGMFFGATWLFFQSAIDTVAKWMTSASMLGEFIYGALNRLLIPLGLHHVLNNYVWFNFGSFEDPSGEVFTGEIPRFMQGDPTAGSYTAGFFPIMMFASIGICLAIYVCAKKKNRPMVGGMLFSVALTAFLTGITEPIEFMFMFLAPPLYVLHALLTGLSFIVCHLCGVLDGFSFSAGLFDYVLNWGLATNPWKIVPIGLCFGIAYFLLFVFFIKKFNLKTPGREDEPMQKTSPDANQLHSAAAGNDAADLPAQYIEALGGKTNIEEISSCITRLRLVLHDNAAVDETVLKSLGAAGVVKADNHVTQVVVGTKAELLAEAIKKRL